MTDADLNYTAFAGARRMAAGTLELILAEAKCAGDPSAILVFDDVTGRLVDIDLRDAGPQDLPPPASAHAEVSPARGRGRPKLGVIAREVTLLPRHWDWLNNQPGGASVALRRLVDGARQANEGKDRIRSSQEAVYRFASAIAGNEPGYEEAIRALYRLDQARFERSTDAWPPDIRDYARRLAAVAFA